MKLAMFDRLGWLHSKWVFICAAGVLAASAAAGCASETGTDSSEQENVTNGEAALGQDPGEEAFKGIFFGVGAYGERLPRVWNKDSAPYRSREDYLKAVQIVVDGIRQKSPTYFTAFGKSVFSRDPVKVSAALQRAIDALNYGVSGLPSNSGQDIWKTENLVWKNDAVYETTRVVHGLPENFEDPYALKELTAVIVQTWQQF